MIEVAVILHVFYVFVAWHCDVSFFPGDDENENENAHQITTGVEAQSKVGVQARGRVWEDAAHENEDDLS